MAVEQSQVHRLRYRGKGPQRRFQRGWDRRAVANAIEAGTWRQGDSGWAEAGRAPWRGAPPPLPMHPWFRVSSV